MEKRGAGGKGDLVAIVSGANMNFDRLRYVAERADIGAQREALFAVQMPEAPGSFLRFCELLGDRSVTEFNYRYESSQAAQIFAGFSLSQGRSERDAVVKSLRDAQFTVTDVTDNEMAKLLPNDTLVKRLAKISTTPADAATPDGAAPPDR